MLTNIVVAAFYHFVTLDDYPELQAPLLAECEAHGVCGTILLASEGINGTIAGPREGIDAVLAYLHADARFAPLVHKESYTQVAPFFRMKVKLKTEIVSMGVPGTDPAHIVGTYLDAEAWNTLLADPEVLVIDTRNQYEVDIGSFKNAISPHTETFRQFPHYVQTELADKKHKKIAMFCTGGIRCEKATSYLKANDFTEVYHLQGGILKYLETVNPADNLWEGECFVFDSRVSVDKDLHPGQYQQCFACRHPISAEDLAHPHYQPGASCPRCYHQRNAQQRRGGAERAKQVALAEQRGDKHLGVPFIAKKPG